MGNKEEKEKEKKEKKKQSKIVCFQMWMIVRG